MGDVTVAEGDSTLVASGVGSCVVIAFFDVKRKLGALAHAMLPHSAPAESRTTSHEKRDMRYVDDAIGEALARLDQLGAHRHDVEAKLIGGANMFEASGSDIGRENVLSAKEKLQEAGIRLVGEAVGGSVGRSVEFSPSSGIVTVRVKF